MPNTHFRFVKQVVSLAQKLTDAAVIQLSHPAGNGFAGWKHAVLLYLREHMDAEYKEVIDWAEEMERIRRLLGLRRGEFPAPSTLCKAFKRAPMSVWRQLLRRRQSCWSRTAMPPSMPRTSTASRHWLITSNGRDDLRSLAADKGYDDMNFRDSLRAVGIRPLIKHRVFAPYDHAHNARIDDARYHQRSTCESVNSSIKLSDGGAVRARDWYRQFKEITLIAGVHNVERVIDA